MLVIVGEGESLEQGGKASVKGGFSG